MCSLTPTGSSRKNRNKLQCDRDVVQNVGRSVETANTNAYDVSAVMEELSATMEEVSSSAATVTDNISNVNDEVISIADDSKAMMIMHPLCRSVPKSKTEGSKQSGKYKPDDRRHHRVAEVSNRGEYQCQTCQ